MLTAKIQFRCRLCDNGQSFYLMPIKEKTKTGSFTNSIYRYDIQCKKCGKHYILKFGIEAI